MAGDGKQFPLLDEFLHGAKGVDAEERAAVFASRGTWWRARAALRAAAIAD